MSRRGNRDDRPRRIIAAYDTETTNIKDELGSTRAFFSLYQIGKIKNGYTLEDVTAENAARLIEVSMFRHDADAWGELLSLAETADDYIPVVAVHNLSFDMHSLAPSLVKYEHEYGVSVLAKSPQKPITITLLDEDGRDRLVFWDSLGFSAKGLEKMGFECGYQKSTGDWDYSRIRTPETKLTEDEKRYAGNDCIALLTWLAWYFRREPLLDASTAGKSILTKTSAVRIKRNALFAGLKPPGKRTNVAGYWRILNNTQKLNTDDMLMTFHACTRGGFTFSSREHSGRAFVAEDGESILAYDATSQHPAHMCAHYMPVDFAERDPERLADDFKIVTRTTPEKLLHGLVSPFPVAFDAAFDFVNLRLKPGTVFARDGISPLASARVKRRRQEDEEDRTRAVYYDAGYTDSAPDGCEIAFGKIFGAPYIRLYLTELDAWVVSRVFEWDEVIPVHGYDTARWQKPSDLSVLSVMHFYRQKNAIKRIRAKYEEGKPYTEEIPPLTFPDAFAEEVRSGRATAHDIDLYYMASKADLNSLYGIEVTDEAKRDLVMTEEGIIYTGEYCADNLPSAPKTCYQYGQRIVGWSRVAQTLVIEGAGKHAKAIINGDTDSVKFLIDKTERENIEAFLKRYADAMDNAKAKTCERVKERYTEYFDELEGIGHYVVDGEFSRFYAAYNKAYLHDDYLITLAGVPAGKGLEQFARELERRGMGFGEVCGQVLGFNVTISPELTDLRGRHIPKWGTRWDGDVTDWRGDTVHVTEPEAVGLYPMAKEIGGYSNPENVLNARCAMRHGFADDEPRLLTWGEDGAPRIERLI